MHYKYTLQEIADWQLKSNNSEVELPKIQRGFVWKTKQIEDLWDSLLRGYPIGAFLLSKTGNRLHLMDGQQRATSIFLGFFNPFVEQPAMETWSIKGSLPTVWIDIKPTSKSETNKYLIRVSTSSHPWGYQTRYNDKTLSVSDRRRALAIYKKHNENKKGYTTFKNTTVFPYDCSYPIPISFIIESESIDDVIGLVEKHLPEYICTKNGNFENKDNYARLLKTTLRDELCAIFETVKQIKNTSILSNTIEQKVLNEESTTEDPTLFVRMNSAGTTLTNDDLIYSIYKAKFPESKTLIEDVGLNFIPPTQVLSLVIRMVAAHLNENSYTKKLNTRDFQRQIADNRFENNLQKIIVGKCAKDIFEQAIDILSCKTNPLFVGEIPPVVVKQFIKDKQEIFLFFIYWLYIHSNVNEKFTDKTKLRMAGKLYTFAWFDFGNIKELWKEKILENNFWDEPLNKLMNGKDGIHFLIESNLLREYYQQPQIEKLFKDSDEHRWGLHEDGVGGKIKQYFNNIKSEIIPIDIANTYFWTFISKIQHNKQLILFAQRNYINSAFEDYNQMENIEDTHVPWDWDHIYPSEWVYNRRNCNQAIRDWNNANGNFRAISLEHNRSRGNSQAPKDISDPEEQEFSFIQSNDWEHWQNIDNRILGDEIQNHFRAITTRTINIYEKFWNDLKIHELIDFGL